MMVFDHLMYSRNLFPIALLHLPFQVDRAILEHEVGREVVLSSPHMIVLSLLVILSPAREIQLRPSTSTPVSTQHHTEFS